MNLRNYLKKHGITQTEFAEKLGVTQGAVTAWITNRRNPSFGMIRRIVAETNGEVTLKDLIYRNEEAPHERDREIVERTA